LTFQPFQPASTAQHCRQYLMLIPSCSSVKVINELTDNNSFHLSYAEVVHQSKSTQKDLYTLCNGLTFGYRILLSLEKQQQKKKK